MISKEIIDSIDEVVIESNIDVFESLCASYDKAYDILEYCSDDDVDFGMFSIIQESTIEKGDTESNADIKKKDKKQGNILSKMLDAIISFFKMIGSAIASSSGKQRKAFLINSENFLRNLIKNAAMFRIRSIMVLLVTSSTRQLLLLKKKLKQKKRLLITVTKKSLMMVKRSLITRQRYL